MSARRAVRGDPGEGFTLVELLVVVLVLGVLASIAVPSFLHHRQRAYDVAAKQTLHELANLQETVLVDHGRYAGEPLLSTPEGRAAVTHGVVAHVLGVDAALSYCLSASHEASPATWFYDNRRGGLLPSGGTCS